MDEVCFFTQCHPYTQPLLFQVAFPSYSYMVAALAIQNGPNPLIPILGLFQSSGSFVTSEERSLAFWLSERGFVCQLSTSVSPLIVRSGYQVFLGNNRAVFNMGHKSLSRSDPRFWDWTMRELAMYDLPALVDYVRDATGYDKVCCRLCLLRYI